MSKFVMVIFGASGDLTKRKLMPALISLYLEKRLPDDFAVLGIGRTKYEDAEYQQYIYSQLDEFTSSDRTSEIEKRKFCSMLHYQTMDPSNRGDYNKLKEKLALMGAGNMPENILYYLATPPSLYGKIPLHLKEVELNTDEARIIVEKPFGYDRKSAEELNEIYKSVFREEQIYRIDHFLGKETAQNILAFRFANGIFEPLWNRNFIDYVEVTAVENLGIENRGGFYEGTGALRDMVQNHLIQLVALMAMEPPAKFTADKFRDEVVKVYDSLAPLTEKDMKENVIRGQYVSNGRFKGYREEKGVDNSSQTETFVAMKLEIDNWRWSGVPFFIRTGKHLATKVSEIVIHFKNIPHRMFANSGATMGNPNKLIIRLQPNEGIVLQFNMKTPGYGFNLKDVSMDFTYDSLGDNSIADPYARLIEDCINGDPILYTRSDAVEASWKFFDPILKYWQTEDAPLYFYPAGSWGPLESDKIITSAGRTWTNPCKNLTKTNEYCEL